MPLCSLGWTPSDEREGTPSFHSVTARCPSGWTGPWPPWSCSLPDAAGASARLPACMWRSVGIHMYRYVRMYVFTYSDKHWLYKNLHTYITHTYVCTSISSLK